MRASSAGSSGNTGSRVAPTGNPTASHPALTAAIDELNKSRAENRHILLLSDGAPSNPFDADELDKKDYRLLLDEAIDSLPEFQRRIVVMWRQDIPIESNDPSVESISKVLGKSEKTIRTHRDKAFASLKLRLERKGKM